MFEMGKTLARMPTGVHQRSTHLDAGPVGRSVAKKPVDDNDPAGARRNRDSRNATRGPPSIWRGSVEPGLDQGLSRH